MKRHHVVAVSVVVGIALNTSTSGKIKPTTEPHEATTKESNMWDWFTTNTTHTKKEKNSRKVTVKNTITREMTGYKKGFFGTFYPTTYTVRINGVPFQPLETKPINVKDNILKVRHDYSFRNGYRKGGKVVTFEVNPDAHEVEVALNWKDKEEWQISVSNAQPIEFVLDEFKPTPHKAAPAA